MSWTTALRAIIRNCYKHHGREDLLPMLDDAAPTVPSPYVMQTINNPDGTLALIQIDTSGSQLAENSEIITLGDGTQAAVVRAVSCFLYHARVYVYYTCSLTEIDELN